MERKLSQDELGRLYECRNIARSLKQKERNINAWLPTRRGLYQSPNLTGMPGARDVHGLDGSASKNEAEHVALEKARADYEDAKADAVRIICAMHPNMHDFCYAYFIDGLDMPVEVADSIGKDTSTCWRKLRKIREGGDFRRKMQRNATKCTEMRDFA